VTKQEVLDQSMRELELQIQKHRQVIESVMESRPLEGLCPWNDCHHQQMLMSMLAETVQVLEETRKAFKSKQLEILRKRLLRVLTRENGRARSEQKLISLEVTPPHDAVR
jgi:hypothetical protein